MQPRVLIVSTIPFNKRSASRAFDAYFHFWKRENLNHIFSNTKTPCKGHCQSLFQITDYRMALRWIKRETKTGEIFNYDELPDEWEDNDLEIGNNSAVAGMYKFGRKHSPLSHCLRGILWRKKFWCTEELNNWLDEFLPECVFVGFSDDFFILQIALYVARKYDIPIVTAIGDDYYFNEKFSLSPFYHLYRCLYKKLVRKFLSYPVSAIYISDKIKNKYNNYFHIYGETVYLSSEIARRKFRKFNLDNPVITYIGHIRAGRNFTLNEIGIALGKIDNRYKLLVYADESDEAFYKIFDENPNIQYCGSLKYNQVIDVTTKSDMVIIAEGFRKEDINLTRYSLSTKAADALASGALILACGPDECGVIDYMKTTEAAIICTDKNLLTDSIYRVIHDLDIQKTYYENGGIAKEKNHTLKSSCSTFEKVVTSACVKDSRVNRRTIR